MSRDGPKPHRVKVVRYRLPDGSKCRKGDPGAVKRVEKTRSYYAWIDGNRVPLKTRDLRTAWKRLRELLAKRVQLDRGERTTLDDENDKPFDEHVAEWVKSVRDRGGGRGTGNLLCHLRTLKRLAGWKTIRDIDMASALGALARVQSQLGYGPRTRNHYTQHAKQFCRWLWLGKRLPEHPLLGLKPVPVEADLRHQRRCPTDLEIAKLFGYLEGSDAATIYGLTPRQRAMGYKVMMATGFRLNELRSLTRESFDLDRGEVSVRAGYSKHRRKDTLQLPTWFVKEIRTYFSDNGECWNSWPEKSAKPIKADLKAAGVPYFVESEHGRLFFDHHALRVHYCTVLAEQPGMDLKTLITLTRHSDPNLALHTYARVRAHRLRTAADQIPQPGTIKKEEKT